MRTYGLGLLRVSVSLGRALVVVLLRGHCVGWRSVSLRDLERFEESRVSNAKRKRQN